MTLRTRWLSLFTLLPLASPAPAQMVPPLPGHGPSPLLFIRLTAPAGVRATFFQGRPQGRSFDAPVLFGVRPGYLYRMEISHLPRRPGVSFFPTLEVRGSLQLPPHNGARSFPAPLVLTDADIDAVLSGSMVTKVIYLENPCRATPVATRPDQPQEIDLPAVVDPLKEARERGRPMVIVRMGGRQLISPEELAHQSVAGTILLPDEKVLAHAACPPPLVLWDTRPFWDPRYGPKPPEEECIHDGGDHGQPAGLDHAGNLHGLEPEDTVAEFTDSHGRRGITCSNTVCLCVPRYAVLRTEVPVGQYDTVVGPGDTRHVIAQQLVSMRQPSEQANKYEQLKALQGRNRPSVNVGTEGVGRIERIEILEAQVLNLGPIVLLGTKAALVLTQVEKALLLRQMEFARQLSSNVAPQVAAGMMGTAVVGRIEGGPQVVSAEVTTRDLTVCCCEVPCPPDKPLVLIKCADRTAAQPGDMVTFMLRFSNHGGKPITDVAVSDSLSPRLEYIPGSAQADRPAVFTTQSNEAGSVILRWEISGTLQPGQSGALRFQARVR
jgi:uncharacterized repeat protein (TIGR01451 family)